VRIYQQPVEEPSGGTLSSDTEPSIMDARGPTVEPELREGSRLGRYVVLGRVGGGGMGVVYAAYDPELDRKVALKLLRSAVGGSSPVEQVEQRTRLLREAQAMARLSHPNVITVHDVGTFGSQVLAAPGLARSTSPTDPSHPATSSHSVVFMAMEFVDGCTLGAWMRERKRPWREVLATLRAAGLGLAAAHDAGLVHRDFKPDNVLVGRDGRVVVTDFGLARPAAGSTDSFAPIPVGAKADAGTRALGIQLTRTGALVGTPAYMAPEQLAGLRSDAQTDQFSFCVALYEGLYGERPFAGKVLGELMANVGEGRLRAPARDADVPRWLRRAIVRGLAVKPDERWPKMSELLAELDRDPVRAWRRRAALGVPVAAFAIVAIAYADEELSRRSYCDDVEQKLAGVWDDPRKTAVRDAFVATAAPYAADAFEAVRARVDDWAQTWVELQTRACRAEAEGTEPHPVLALRMACLDRNRQALGALADVLESADAATIERSLEAVEQLPRLSHCDDIDALAARARAFAGKPDQAEAIDAALARSRVLGTAARYDAAETAIDAALRDATAAGYRAGEAEALVQRARLLDVRRDLSPAETAYHAALDAAFAADATEIAIQAITGLVWLLGEPDRPLAEAERWHSHGKALLDRLGGDAELEAELANALGIAYLNHADLVHAEQWIRATVAVREAELGEGHTSVGAALQALGQVLAMQGEYDDAIAMFERSLALIRREYGDRHPHVASALGNLGAAFGQAGDIERSRELQEEAIRIRSATMGPDHPDNATAYLNLANTLLETGRLDDARRHAARALAMYERTYGPNHPHVAGAAVVVGNIEFRGGDAAAAVEQFERALAIATATAGADAAQAARYRQNLGLALVEVGRIDEAVAHLRSSVEIRERTLGPDHPAVADGLRALANVLGNRGRAAEAVPLAERALAIHASGNDALEVAEDRFTLAQALWESGGDRARARSLAEQAQATWVAAAPQGQRNENAWVVRAWLAAHEIRADD
jgi:tetratricopeptide (TPR) repeat protein